MGSQTHRHCDKPELVTELRNIPGLPPDREGEAKSQNPPYAENFIAGLYQKESLYNHYLPVPLTTQDKDSQAWLEEIKNNLAEAVMLRELRPGLTTWLTR